MVPFACLSGLGEVGELVRVQGAMGRVGCWLSLHALSPDGLLGEWKW